jgi:hypothetical protein
MDRQKAKTASDLLREIESAEYYQHCWMEAICISQISVEMPYLNGKMPVSVLSEGVPFDLIQKQALVYYENLLKLLYKRLGEL